MWLGVLRRKKMVTQIGGTDSTSCERRLVNGVHRSGSVALVTVAALSFGIGAPPPRRVWPRSRAR
jgi:hypothetical protein